MTLSSSLTVRRMATLSSGGGGPHSESDRRLSAERLAAIHYQSESCLAIYEYTAGRKRVPESRVLGCLEACRGIPDEMLAAAGELARWVLEWKLESFSDGSGGDG